MMGVKRKGVKLLSLFLSIKLIFKVKTSRQLCVNVSIKIRSKVI